MMLGRRMPEMIEAYAQHIGQRREAGNMTTQIAIGTIGFDHHGHRVPAHVGAQPLLVFEIAGTVLAEVRGNGIDVSGIAGKGNMSTAATGQIDHALKEVMRTLRSFVIENGFESVEPFLRFHHIGIIGGLRQDSVDLRCHQEVSFIMWRPVRLGRIGSGSNGFCTAFS